MIVGVIEKLDRMVRKYREGDENVDFDDVMDCVVDSVACDDCWYVSAELMEDGMNETDFEESRCIGDLPLFKTALVNGEDEKYLAAYTSEEAVRGGGARPPEDHCEV